MVSIFTVIRLCSTASLDHTSLHGPKLSMVQLTTWSNL